VLDVVKAERLRVVLVDFTAVVSIDSVSIRAVAELCRSLRLVGALPLLCGFRADVAIQLVEAGIGGVAATVFGTQADAIEHAFSHVGMRVVRATS
jgi:anti-anti-sigma regulatory factor